MKKGIIKLLGLTMLLGVFGTITAQHAQDKKRKFEEIDVNKDDFLSMSELRTFRIAHLESKGKTFSEEKFAERFAKLDANGDLLLSKKELRRARKLRKEKKSEG